MKDIHECNKTNDSHAECNKRMELNLFDGKSNEGITGGINI